MERPRAITEPGFSRELQEGKESLGGREVAPERNKNSMECVLAWNPRGQEENGSSVSSCGEDTVNEDCCHLLHLPTKWWLCPGCPPGDTACSPEN